MTKHTRVAEPRPRWIANLRVAVPMSPAARDTARRPVYEPIGLPTRSRMRRWTPRPRAQDRREDSADDDKSHRTDDSPIAPR